MENAESLTMCVEMLKEGYVGAFTQFFSLVHPSEIEAAPAGPQANAPTIELRSVKDQLMEAEECERRGDYDAACGSYTSLAEQFVAPGSSQTHLDTAIDFHSKVLNIRDGSRDALGTAVAQSHLGQVHVAKGDLLSAIACHEQQAALAQSLGIEGAEQRRLAQQSLVAVYTAQAARYSREEGMVDAAVEMYHKCLDAARSCGDMKSEGLTQHRLGLTLAGTGDMEGAMRCQQLYRDSCAAQTPEDKRGQGKACQAMAGASRMLGDHEGAARYLEECVQLASSAEDTTAQASACASLGSLYRAEENHAAALQYFEKCFELARAAKGQAFSDKSGAPEPDAEAAAGRDKGGALSLTDSARAALGLARGMAAMEKFSDVVQHDLPALLQWRNRRLPLDRT